MMNPTTVAQEKNGLTCSACVAGGADNEINKRPFVTTDQLWAHISTVHFSFHPFECVFCPMVFMPSEGVLKQHYERLHPRKAPQAIYTYDEKKKTEIRDIFLNSQRLSGYVQCGVATEETNNQQEISPSCIDTFNIISSTREDRVATDEKVKSLPIQASSKDRVVQNSAAQKERTSRIPPRKQSDLVPIGVIAVPTEETCQNLNNKKRRPETESPNFVDRTEIFNEREKQNQCRILSVKANSAKRSFVKKGAAKVEEKARRSGADSDSDVEIWEGKEEEKKRNEQMETDSADSMSDCRPDPKAPRSPPRLPMRYRSQLESIMCQLCNKEMENQKPKTTLHIWHCHINGFRFRCNFCDYGVHRPDLIKRHAILKHSDQSTISWTDHTLELMPHFKRQYDSAFEKSAQVGTATCTLCDQTMSVGSKVYHIWKHHMSAARYICRQCDQGQSILSDMKKHLRVAEHDKAGCIDNTRPLHGEYEKMFSAAFRN